MSTINDGGSAFSRPVSWSEEGGTHRGTLGMTLRDYFAAKALMGILAHKNALDWTYLATAEDSYRYADAMIKAREGKQ